MQYLYYSVPVVSGITPTGGPTSGQTQVVLRGSISWGLDYRCSGRALCGDAGKLRKLTCTRARHGCGARGGCDERRQFSTGGVSFAYHTAEADEHKSE